MRLTFNQQLSNEERVEIARHVAEKADGRIPVVAGGTYEEWLSRLWQKIFFERCCVFFSNFWRQVGGASGADEGDRKVRGCSGDHHKSDLRHERG